MALKRIHSDDGDNDRDEVLKCSRIDEMFSEHGLPHSNLFANVQPYLYHDNKVYNYLEKSFVLPRDREHHLQLEILNVHYFSGEFSNSSLLTLFNLVEHMFTNGYFQNTDHDRKLIQSYFEQLIERDSFRCSSLFFIITKQLTLLVQILQHIRKNERLKIFQAFCECKRKHFHFLSENETPEKYIVFDYHQLFQHLKPLVLEHIAKCTKFSEFKIVFEIEEIRSDKTFVLAGLKISENVIRLASKNMQNNKEVVMKTVSYNGLYIKFASDELREDIDVVIEALNNNPLALQFLSEKIRNDRELVFRASMKNIQALLYASEWLQYDREFVLDIIDKSSNIDYFWLPFEYKHDREVIKRILLKKRKQDALYIRDMFIDFPDLLKNDKEILLLSVKYSEACLHFIHTQLKNNKDFALEIVKVNGLCLQYMNSKVKKMKHIVLEAVKENGLALEFVPLHMKEKYPEILFQAVCQNGRALQYVPQENNDFLKLFFEAVNRDAQVVQFLQEDQKASKDIALMAVNLNWKSLEYFHSSVRDNKQIVLATLQKDERAIAWVSDRLINEL